MAKINNEFVLTNKAKEILISKLTDELLFLRTKLGLSQEDLSKLLGVSRQTYSTLETKKRVMSWSTYLSLVLIFDNNKQTHDLIHDIGIFPYILFEAPDSNKNQKKLSDISGLMLDDIKDKLDEQAFHSIETVIMLEYARCNNMSGDAVIKAFDGKKFTNISDMDAEISKTTDLIKSEENEK